MRDADFFLDLLAGPRDRDGLPESIRFWKYRVEDRGLEQAFRVGLIYGPTGCGKSSFVKAGLLPRLASDVISVYIEATADETEVRLLRSLRARSPQLSGNLGIAESVSAIRCGEGLPPGKKLLLVVDQFEQWLHAKPTYENTELVRALRQCDGERVQCIFMVRDDFWMKVTRFLRELDVCLEEGKNSSAVDLFSVDHAKRILKAFGRAFGKLPEEPAELSKEQRAFVQQATAELAEDGKVICVRLALFADMMKGKPWTPAALRAVGGIAGVGVTFLEETFSAATAPPQHRLHQKAAREVLRALLPASGASIKGRMRSANELLTASGYEGKPADYEELIRILNTEVRLITPTDPECGEQDRSAPPTVSAGQKYYQLTHDYVVPSLRDWLTRKDNETMPGRARLLLEERAREWAGSHEDRFLPSLRETALIALLTRRKARTKIGQDMLRHVFWVHGRRIGIAVALLAVFALIIWRILPRQPLDVLRDTTWKAENRLEALHWLDLADPEVFKQVLIVLDNDTNKDFISGLVDAIRADLQTNSKTTQVRREEFASSLQGLLARTTLPADVRLISLRSLVLGDAAVFDWALKTLDEDRDPRFIAALADAIHLELEKDSKNGDGRCAKFSASLQKVLANSKLPARDRQNALRYLDLSDPVTFDQVLKTLDDDEDSAFVRGLVETIRAACSARRQE